MVSRNILYKWEAAGRIMGGSAAFKITKPTHTICIPRIPLSKLGTHKGYNGTNGHVGGGGQAWWHRVACSTSVLVAGPRCFTSLITPRLAWDKTDTYYTD